MLKNKYIRLTIIILSIIMGLWLLILVVLQVLFKTSVLDNIINKVATELVDGDVNYSKVKINVVKSFPNLNVTIDSLSLTYPHDRWQKWDSTSMSSPLLPAGRGEVSDTLASFETFSASIDYVAAMFGKVHSHGIKLSGVKFYAHQYGDGQANWQMFRTGAPDTTEEVEDTTSFSLPPISIDRIILNHHPQIVYTAQGDTVFLLLDMNRLVLHGDLEKFISDRKQLLRRNSPTTRQPRRSLLAKDLEQSIMGTSIRRDSVSHRMDMKNSSIALHLDSLFVGGRLSSDTLGLFVDFFEVQDHGRRIAFELDGRSMLMTGVFGRLQIPIHLNGEVGMEESRRHAGSMVYQLRQFNGSVAYIPVLMNAMVRQSPDSMYVNVAMKVDNCPIGDVLSSYGKNFSPFASEFHTNAHLTLTADCKGFVDIPNGIYPTADVTISLPEATVKYDQLPKDCKVALSADASLTDNGLLDVHLGHLLLDVNGLYANLSGQAADLLGKDPIYTLNGVAETNLGDLAALLPDSVGPLQANGLMHLDVDARARQSQICKMELTEAKINAILYCDSIDVRYPKTGLVATIDTMSLKVNDMKSLVDTTQRAVGARLALDSIHFGIGEELSLQGKDIRLLGNLASKEVDATVPVPEFKGKLAFERLEVTGQDSMRFMVRQMDNVFTIDKFFSPRMADYIPRLSLSTKVERMSLRMDDSRLGLKGVAVNLSALKRRHNVATVDTVFKQRPLLVADTAGLQVQLPDFLTEKDFEKGDIDIKVSESLRQYLSAWFPKGDISLDRGRVVTPILPLRNRIDTLRIHFNGNSFHIDKMGVRSGSSNLSATGTFKRLSKQGAKLFASLDMDITSDGMDVDELLLAWNKGKQLQNTESIELSMEQVGDEANMESLLDSAAQQLPDSIGKQLIVVPANLQTDIRIKLDSVSYSNLLIDTLQGNIVSKGRCLQLTGWKALSNMGTMQLDAFYSTRTKKDISAGFNLAMQDITAQEVIGLIPMVDSVMPLLKTFKGNLNCELTATTQLDTCMNFMLPTLNGVFKISGKKLGLEESAALRKIARLLLFRNKWTGDIDDMSAYGMISNNMLEIFPFILSIDRYMLALEGHQDLNQPFEYYLSVITSPLPFQFGISLYGDTYDKWKYRLGPTKYTHSYYLPIFRNEVDSVQVNLISSIHSIFDRGVERVLRDNLRQAGAVDSLRAGSRDLPPVDDKQRQEVERQYRELESSSAE